MRKFEQQLQKYDRPLTAVEQYRYARALMNKKDFAKAQSYLESLYQSDWRNLAYTLALSELYIAQEKFTKADELLLQGLKINPGNHALTMAYAELKLQQRDAETAVRYLSEHKHRNPSDANVFQSRPVFPDR